MNEKSQLYHLSQTSNNFRATVRWLHKSQPELWSRIVKLTEFLSSPSAPQRAWHVMNDVYNIPLCPISGKSLGWHCLEHGYKKTGDKESRYHLVALTLQETVERDGHWRENDQAKAMSANEKFTKNYADGLHKPFSERARDVESITAKAKETCLKKYGVDNYWKSEEFKAWQKSFYDEKFKETREQKSEKEKYYHEVYAHTRKNWCAHFYRINPNRLERGPELHLDHIYSISQGFIDRINPEIIGHWTNLRLIPSRENESKQDRCDKTYEQLMEDFDKG